MQRESRPVTVKCFSEMLIEIETAVWRICETRGQPTNTGQWVGHHHHLPHVDEILGQSHGLAVPCDGDGPVQVGGGVSVLAVGDADHGSAYLPVNIEINIILWHPKHIASSCETETLRLSVIYFNWEKMRERKSGATNSVFKSICLIFWACSCRRVIMTGHNYLQFCFTANVTKNSDFSLNIYQRLNEPCRGKNKKTIQEKMLRIPDWIFIYNPDKVRQRFPWGLSSLLSSSY